MKLYIILSVLPAIAVMAAPLPGGESAALQKREQPWGSVSAYKKYTEGVDAKEVLGETDTAKTKHKREQPWGSVSAYKKYTEGADAKEVLGETDTAKTKHKREQPWGSVSAYKKYTEGANEKDVLGV